MTMPMFSPGLDELPMDDRALAMLVESMELSIKEDERRSLPPISTHAFTKKFWHVVEPKTPFQDNWHIGCISEHLDAVSMGQISDLLFNLPPGCMKSLTVSVMFPAKEWTHNPEYRYLGGSYDEGLQIRDNLKMRMIVESEEYQREWPLKFKRDQNTKTKMENERSGWRIATSIGGKGTGEHPHRKLIDDPHNVKKSLSDKFRKEAITWFDLTMGSRGLALNAATILTMQRLHMKDLSGHIMEQLREQFVIIVLPMRYEPPAWVEIEGKKRMVPRMEKTPLGFQDPRKKPGELLFPQLFPLEKVQKLEGQLRASHGEFGVAGQLQQRPVPQAGGLIKREWFQIVDAIPSTERVIARVRGWDCAATDGGGDWTVGSLLALCESGRVYIEHVLRGQWGPETFEGPNGIFVQTVKADGRGVRQREEKEGGSAGKKVIHAHSLLIPGFDYEGETAKQDKATRNAPFRAFAANGNVLLVRGEWNKAHLDVLCVFPNGDCDDDVDADSIAFNDVTLGAPPLKKIEVNIG